MWPCYLARKQLFPPRRFPLFAFISIVGVALGVTALLVVQTVMHSFGEEHRRRIRESYGDVIVHAGGSPIGAATRTSALLLQKTPGATAAAPYLEGQAILMSDEADIRFVGVRGIDLDGEARVIPLDRYWEAGRKEDFDDEHVILGATLAENLGLGLGATLTLTSPGHIAQAIDGQRISLPKEFHVSGIIRTGFRPADEQTILLTRRAAAELFGAAPDTASAIHLKLRDHTQAGDTAHQLNRHLPGNLRAAPWSGFRKAFLDAVAMEKELLFFLMFIIILVASFSIGSTLFNHVVRRTREIGLLGALGARPRQILQIYITQGILIGLAGYALGATLAVLILHFRQQIVQLMGQGETLLQQYQFAKVPLHYNTPDFLKTALLTLLLMTTVSLLPALWAARRKPSEAMRDAG
ncbi:MAG: ABC transporter permease [Puniceicoccales bacterium]|jgi:lipoprotein-releasing system permease protein|nr:ABC transporter permease [Puniceicoccales bacterium]